MGAVEKILGKRESNRRAATWSALLLIVAVSLAFILVRYRRESIPLVEFAPRGWLVRFRVPAILDHGDMIVYRGRYELVPLYGTDSNGRSFKIILWRYFPARSETVGTIARTIIQRATGLSGPFQAFLSNVSISEQSIGPWEGFEAMLPSETAITRLAKVSPEEVYAVSLALDELRQAPITPGTHSLFSAICRSARPNGSIFTRD